MLFCGPLSEYHATLKVPSIFLEQVLKRALVCASSQTLPGDTFFIKQMVFVCFFVFARDAIAGLVSYSKTKDPY